MCKLQGCTLCGPNQKHYCRNCGALDYHFTRDCNNYNKINEPEVYKLFKNAVKRKTHEPLSNQEAYQMAIKYEDQAQEFCYNTYSFMWFKREDLGKHFDYFKNLQMNCHRSYGNSVRFANNNIELLTNPRWRVFVHAVLNRFGSPEQDCKNNNCEYYKKGMCYSNHL